MSASTGLCGGQREIVVPTATARDTRLKRDVAVKILPREFATDTARRQRFESEARTVAALNHPNIVAIYDVGTENGALYIVTELIDGQPLRGAFALRKVLDYAIQAANGLAAAHAAGIIHRDLKPDNILLTRDGRIKILDFGLAKVNPAKMVASAETLTVHTEPGTVMGTVGYMSPEQVRGGDTDHRSDLFSFGLILYELLAAKRAFQGETPVDTMQAILRQDAPDLPDDVPAAVRLVVAHCLEKDPASRFQSARDLGFALSAILQSGSTSAVTAVGATPRRNWLLALAALVITVVCAVGAVLWLRAPAPAVWTGVLLGGPEQPMVPRLAPDGHTLGFLAIIDDIPQVAVMKPETGNWAVLTHSKDNGYIPLLSWSPDGTKIYYDRWTDVPRGIYSVPALGGGEQLVLEDAGLPEALPDGSLLVARYNSERQFQLHQFWPDTGRMQPFPLELSVLFGSPLRAFPDGKEAVVVGTRIGPGREDGPQVYLLDLASGHVRRLTTTSLGGAVNQVIATTRDGKSVLATVATGNTFRIAVIGRDGRMVNPNLLTLANSVYSIDPAADGSIYLDQVERPADVVRFSAQGGHAEKIATLPNYEGTATSSVDEESFAVLPDGRAVLTQDIRGRKQLILIEAGKDPVPFLNTTEPTSSPVTAVGPNQIAFLIGPKPQRTIALAPVSTGRITRRIPFDKGDITSLASAADGKTLYCAAGGDVWSIHVESGEAKRIRAGDHVAVDPSGRYLLVQVTETPVIRLIRVPVDGGAEQEIPRGGPLRPANIIGPNAIGKNGLILTPLGSTTVNWPAGLLDPSTGRFTPIPIDYKADYHVLNWTPDGKVLGLGLSIRSKLWKFQPITTR
jgi:hypothetical protein